MKNSVLSSGFVLVAILAGFMFPGTASAQSPMCPIDCKVYANIEIAKGDTLRIVHNNDQEAIAVRLNGSDISLLSFKNTHPDVQLYLSCQTGLGSSNKIDWLTGGQYADCRQHSIGKAQEFGLNVVRE